jgi:spermidine synthase
VLLGGYAAAHLSLLRLPVRRHVAAEIGLLCLALVALPVALPTGWENQGGMDPAIWTLLILLVMVGAPFFMLSTVGPTLQRWFSHTTHPRAHDPYFLYAAGNAGSLLGLLAYPFLLEPAVSLSRQSLLWSWIYAMFVVSCGLCAILTLRHRTTGQASHGAAGIGGADQSSASIGWRRQVRWTFFAFIPSALMLGVTRYLSNDIAAVPLLWIVPLSLYIATFIVAFGRDPDKVVRLSSRAFRVLAVPLVLSFIGLIPNLWVQLPLQLGAFVAAGLVAHGRLAADRPPASQLTRFFLLLSAGGVLGGIFSALVAPMVFTSVLEYPIAIVLAVCVLPANQTSIRSSSVPRIDGRLLVLSALTVGFSVATVAVRSIGSERALTLSMLIAAVGLAGAFALARRPSGFAGAVGVVLLLAHLVPPNPTLFAERTFFGIHRVYVDTYGRHVLLNGTTVHGVQNVLDGQLSSEPTSYYSQRGPVGDIFSAITATPPQRIATIGAGSGTLATYLRPGDSLTFYEIDDAVIRIASNPSLFTFVSASRGRVGFVLGDGRVELERAEGTYDMVVVDAFSGDAIPTHLLTSEAMKMYLEKTVLDGLIVFNISNRYFDLLPVLARVAAEDGLTGVVRSDTTLTLAEAEQGTFASRWVVLGRSSDDLGGFLNVPGWVSLGGGQDAPLWTDDYSDLLGTLR